MTSVGYRGQRALVAMIDGYRRWGSGKGPLRRVRCTFHHGETCSAYGRRIALEAPGLRAAIAAIRARLRRCGGAALYALPDQVLGWGEDYDRPLAAWTVELAQARELPSTRAQLLRARVAVARWRGDHLELGRLAAMAPALAGPRLVVRQARIDRGAALAGRAPAAALAFAMIALVALLTTWWLATAAGLVAITGLAAGLARGDHRLRRLRWQAQAAAIARGSARPAAATPAAGGGATVAATPGR